MVITEADEVVVDQVHRRPGHEQIKKQLVEVTVEGKEIPFAGDADEECGHEYCRGDHDARAMGDAPAGEERMTERDHCERAAIETDGTGHCHTRCEEQHDEESYALSGEMSDGGDDVAVGDGRADHGAEDHRQHRTERRAPIAGPEGAARSGVRRQIA